MRRVAPKIDAVPLLSKVAPGAATATSDEVRGPPCTCGSVHNLDEDGCCRTCGADWNYELALWQDGHDTGAVATMTDAQVDAFLRAEGVDPGAAYERLRKRIKERTGHDLPPPASGGDEATAPQAERGSK